MKEFKDLIFKTRFTGEGIISRLQFDNGYGVSVAKHDSSYGGKLGLYELAVLDSYGELHYDNPVAKGDVVGYLREEDVTDAMALIQKFEPLQ
jgi:hypothetical protein